MNDYKELNDRLVGALIGLARATEGNEHLLSPSTIQTVIDALCLLKNTESANQDNFTQMLLRIDEEKRKLVPDCYHCVNSCGRTADYDMVGLSDLNESIRSLKLRILSKIQTMACRLTTIPPSDDICRYFYKALYSIGADDWGLEELLPILLELDI